MSDCSRGNRTPGVVQNLLHYVQHTACPSRRGHAVAAEPRMQSPAIDPLDPNVASSASAGRCPLICVSTTCSPHPYVTAFHTPSTNFRYVGARPSLNSPSESPTASTASRATTHQLVGDVSPTALRRSRCPRKRQMLSTVSPGRSARLACLRSKSFSQHPCNPASRGAFAKARQRPGREPAATFYAENTQRSIGAGGPPPSARATTATAFAPRLCYDLTTPRCPGPTSTSSPPSAIHQWHPGLLRAPSKITRTNIRPPHRLSQTNAHPIRPVRTLTIKPPRPTIPVYLIPPSPLQGIA